LKEKNPDHAKEIDELYFGTFGSGDRLEESVREDLRFLRQQEMVKQEIKDNARGYIYDIKSGKLNEVV
jgi:carbonic anhydrase